MTKLHPFALVMAVVVGTACSSGGMHVPGSGGNAATGGAQGDGGGATGGSGGVSTTATGGTAAGGSGGSGGIHGTGGIGSGGQSGGSGGTGGGSASGGQAGSSMDAAIDATIDAATDGTPDAHPETETRGSGFAAVLAIFKQRCTECHAAGAIAPGMPKLHLTADVAYSSLVGKPAEETCGGILVVPSDSAKSYLFRKIADATSCEGVQMPMAYEGRFNPLTTADVDTIRSWIDQGAPP